MNLERFDERLAGAERELGISLRDFQRRAVELVLDGRDVVVHSPTGSGKTAIFHALALMGGPVLVISPLVSLIEDQRRRCHEIGLPSSSIYGAIQGRRREEELARIASGEAHLVYTTPETLTTSQTLAEALRAGGGATCLAIDEAHAFEDWAHAFRPAYRRLGAAMEALGIPRALLLSATLTNEGVLQAATLLGRAEWSFVTEDPVRPNLTYLPWDPGFETEEVRRLLKEPGAAPGIVYCLTVRRLETLALRLSRSGLPSFPIYHGKLADGLKREVQADWTAGAGWIGATKAFGMGIDKPDVRTILHLQLPLSLVDLAQETGRAGRDGRPSRCLLSIGEDGGAARFLIGLSYPPPEALPRVLAAAKKRLTPGAWMPLDRRALAREADLPERAVGSALAWLSARGLLHKRPITRTLWISLAPEHQELAQDLAEKDRALLAALKIAGEVDRGGYRIHRDALQEEVGHLFPRGPRRALERLEQAGAILFLPPAARIEYRDGQGEPDLVEAAILRDRALARLAEVQDFSRSPASERAERLRRAIGLELRSLEVSLKNNYLTKLSTANMCFSSSKVPTCACTTEGLPELGQDIDLPRSPCARCGSPLYWRGLGEHRPWICVSCVKPSPPSRPRWVASLKGPIVLISKIEASRRERRYAHVEE